MFVKFSALVDEMRGKYNGTVFRKKKNGGTVAQPKPSNQGGMKLTKADAGRLPQIKNSFGACANAWVDLDPEYKASWNSVATTIPHTNKFGQSVTLTGFQYFMLICSQARIYFNATPQLPPVLDVIPTLPTVSGSTDWDGTEGKLFINVSGFQAEPWYLVINGACLRGLGRAVKTKNYKFLITMLYDATTQINVGPYWKDLFGVLQNKCAVDFEVFWIHELTMQKTQPQIITIELNA